MKKKWHAWFYPGDIYIIAKIWGIDNKQVNNSNLWVGFLKEEIVLSKHDLVYSLELSHGRWCMHL